MPEKKNQNKDVASNEKTQQGGSNRSNPSGRSKNEQNKQSGSLGTGMGDETDIENQQGGSMQNQQGGSQNRDAGSGSRMGNTSYQNLGGKKDTSQQSHTMNPSSQTKKGSGTNSSSSDSSQKRHSGGMQNRNKDRSKE